MKKEEKRNDNDAERDEMQSDEQREGRNAERCREV